MYIKQINGNGTLVIYQEEEATRVGYDFTIESIPEGQGVLRCDIERREVWYEPENDLAARKADKVAASKTALEAYLAAHPLTWADGKQYSVTAEKQALLNNALAVYQLAAQAAQPTVLTWNATGEECTVWAFDALCGLALGIAAHVKPLVAHQQALEVQIGAAQTVGELDEVVISYA